MYVGLLSGMPSVSILLAPGSDTGSGMLEKINIFNSLTNKLKTTPIYLM